MCTHRHNHKFNKTRNTYKLSIFDGRLRFQNPVGLIVNRCHGSSHCHCRPSLQSLSRDTFSIGVPHYSRCHGSSHVHCCPSLQDIACGSRYIPTEGPGLSELTDTTSYQFKSVLPVETKKKEHENKNKKTGSSTREKDRQEGEKRKKNLKEEQKSETRMTAGVLKQHPNT